MKYDVVVIGSGMTGGYAAMEFCLKGYKTLVLERGRHVEHGQYPTANLEAWELPHRNIVSEEEKAAHYFKQNRIPWWVNQANKPWVVRDDLQPYLEQKRFDWIRGNHVGGRSIMWGRHCYRWSDLDFEANKKDGVGIDWPIRYKDIAPWYDKVERFMGICGKAEGLAQLPDGIFLPPFPLDCVEQHIKSCIEAKFPERIITPGRVANLTQYSSVNHQGARSQCQNRNRCARGCPLGAYFNSLSSTLSVAAKTGNLTLRSDSIVSQIIYDSTKHRATGVQVTDAKDGSEYEYSGDVIFCNAGTVATTAILLNSRSPMFPDGLGNHSGELGRNLMDHHYQMGAEAQLPGFEAAKFIGEKPVGFYIPRFRNINSTTARSDYIRGFGMQGAAQRRTPQHKGLVGKALKHALQKPGPISVNLIAFGEMLPYSENSMTLNFKQKDQYGQPLIQFNAELKTNELTMREDATQCAAQMLESAGCIEIKPYNEPTAPGACIHEMGTARMGHSVDESILNHRNQLHTVDNVFVTDGACMASSGTQNPSLTFMALTARAVDYAQKTLLNV